MLITLIIVLILAILYYLNKPLNYWKNKNVKYIKPLPFFGNTLPLISGKLSNAEFLQNCCRQFPNERFVGIWQFFTPALILKDPEIIKNISIKDFETFPNHRPISSMKVDSFWCQNLFAIQGLDKWQSLRTVLSPAYTTGKIKVMFGSMTKSTNNLLKHLSVNNEAVVEVEIKDTFLRLSAEILAVTALGVSCDALSDTKNEFYRMVQKSIDFTGIKSFRVMIHPLSSIFDTILRMPLISKKVARFFHSVITQTIMYRKTNNITRPDVLQLLIKAQNSSKNLSSTSDAKNALDQKRIYNEKIQTNFKITDQIISAVLIHFLFAGVESISTLISYAIYEIALNPNIQEKLYLEIKETFKEAKEEITYNALMQMKYLDMVISETLRKWPPFHVYDRIAETQYTIPGKYSCDPDLMLEKNSLLLFPVLAIHRDPKFYPNPDKFDPERFNDKNKSSIVPYSYIPFGVGPRNCIGLRFALVEAKLVVVSVMRNFEIVQVAKTRDTIIFDKNNFLALPKDGFWVGLRKRK